MLITPLQVIGKILHPLEISTGMLPLWIDSHLSCKKSNTLEYPSEIDPENNKPYYCIYHRQLYIDKIDFHPASEKAYAASSSEVQ